MTKKESLFGLHSLRQTDQTLVSPEQSYMRHISQCSRLFLSFLSKLSCKTLISNKKEFLHNGVWKSVNFWPQLMERNRLVILVWLHGSPEVRTSLPWTFIRWCVVTEKVYKRKSKLSWNLSVKSSLRSQRNEVLSNIIVNVVAHLSMCTQTKGVHFEWNNTFKGFLFMA